MRWSNTILLVSRPRLWVYLGGMYVMGFVLGAPHLRDLQPWRFWIHLVFFLPLANLLLYGVNDLCDHEPADPPATTKTSTRAQQRRLVMYGVLAAVLINCVLIGLAHTWLEQLLLGLFLLLTLLNSFPPVRLKARPVLDLLASGLYVLPAFLGYYQASGHYPAALVVIAAVCWTSALRLLSSVQEVMYDRDAGVCTTAVALGVRTSLLVCALLWSGFALIVVVQGYLMPLSLAAFVYPFAGFFLFENFDLVKRVSWWLPWLNGALGGAVIVLALVRLS